MDRTTRVAPHVAPHALRTTARVRAGALLWIIPVALVLAGRALSAPPVPADGDELQRAIDRAAPGATIRLPGASIRVTKPLVIGDRPLTLLGEGEGTLLFTSEPIPIIRKTGSGNRLALERIRFDAQVPGATGLEYSAPRPTLVQNQELVVTNCTFTGPGSGVILTNVREPLIAASRFTVGESGVVLRGVSNGSIISCFFSPLLEGPGTRGIFFDGYPDDTFAAGLRIIGCTVMGCAVGVDIVGTDFLAMTSNIVDYCDLPVRLRDQDGAAIHANYFGSRGERELGEGVCVEILGATRMAQHITLQGNTIVSAPETVPVRTGIRARRVHGLRIVDNTIHFWNAFGVDNDSCSRVTIEGNTVLSDPENTGTSVARPTSGTTLIPPGQRTVTVRHGLGIVPGRPFATPDVPIACGVTATAGELTITLHESQRKPVRVAWRVEE